MITVNRLRELAIEVKQLIPEIKKTLIVVDDTQFLKILKDYEINTDILFVIVLPDYNIKSKNQDVYKWNNNMGFFILEKYVHKDLDDEEKLDIHERTAQVMKKFVQGYLLGGFQDSNVCGIFDDIVADSISISPVWEKAQTNGYEITFDMYGTT
jgi:benzoyl-CoA reductase/2-hydroxyglutaryl-CoA dehydratase subunit BcrC/BadD/HgdB